MIDIYSNVMMYEVLDIIYKFTFLLDHTSIVGSIISSKQERFGFSCNRISFNQDWTTYKQGFGEVVNFDCDFWLGLEKIHKMTTVQGKKYKMDTTLAFQDPTMSEYYQTYLINVYVDTEVNGYRLHAAQFKDGCK